MGKIELSPPVLAFFTGVACSGKKTLLNGLYVLDGGVWVKKAPGVRDNVKAIYIAKDMIADAIGDGFPEEDVGSRRGDFYGCVREAAYSAIYRMAVSNLNSGYSVFVNATYWTEIQDPAWVDVFRKPVQEAGAKLKITRCFADEDIIIRRMKDRDYERDKWKLEHLEEHFEREPIRVKLPKKSPKESIEIDTGKYPPEYNVRTAIEFMED